MSGVFVRFEKICDCWVDALNLAILRLLRNLNAHVDSKCGQISLWFLWHSVRFGWCVLWARIGFFGNCPYIVQI